MENRQVDLTDPNFEPSLADFNKLRAATVAAVQAESAMLAERRKREEGEQKPSNLGMSFDKK